MVGKVKKNEGRNKKKGKTIIGEDDSATLGRPGDSQFVGLEMSPL